MIGPAAATFERVAAEYEYGRPSWPAEGGVPASKTAWSSARSADLPGPRVRESLLRGSVPVVEDEQLLRAVPLARDVREDALPHVLALSDALYARFAAW